jgi:uncharacterized membrane protein YbhN (UPF0104 family)
MRNAPRKTNPLYVRLLITGAVLLCFLWAGAHLLKDSQFMAVWGRLRQANPLWAVGIAAAYILTSFLNGEIMRLILKPLGHTLTHRQAFAVFMLRTYANLLASKTGPAVAVAYLKLRFGVGISDSLSMLIMATVLQFLGIGLAGLAGLTLMIAFCRTPLHPLIAAVFAASMVGSALVLFLNLPVPRSFSDRVAGFLTSLNESRRRVVSHRVDSVLAPRLMLIQLAVLLLRAGRLWLAFAAYEIPPRPIGLFVASLLGDIGFLVGITPMGLGFREAAIGYGARLAGTSAQSAVAVALVDRLIWSVAVLTVAQAILLKSTLSRPHPPEHPAP